MYVNHGGPKYGDVNCALCSVGAILKCTSAEVAHYLGLNGIQNDQTFAAAYYKRRGRDLAEIALTSHQFQDATLKGIKEFVKAVMAHEKNECYVSQGGSTETMVPMQVQTKLMGIYPIGTQYAVYACFSLKGAGAHWNYAVRNEDGVVFKDYQYNDSEDHPPAVSASFIPPRGNPEVKSSEYTQGIVLVFRSRKALV